MWDIKRRKRRMTEEKPLSEKVETCEYPKGFPIGKWIKKEDVAHAIKRILEKWRKRTKIMELMTGDVAYFELKGIIEDEIGDLK